MRMWLSLVEPILKLFVMGLGMYMDKTAKDQQSAEDYLAFLEIMSRKGLASVQMRLKAVDQMQRIKDLWSKDGQG